MKIAITGSNSNLGKFLSSYLKKKKIKLILINRNKNYSLLNKDTFNFNNKKIDILIHLAHNYSKNSKVINYSGSVKLFDKARKQNIKKIIFISSLSSHKKAISIYGNTKYLIEKYCKKNNITIIRPGIIFGNKIDKKIALLFYIMKFFPIIPYFKSNKNYLYAVHIKELTENIYKIINQKDIARTYNIFCNQKIYFEDLINIKFKYKLKIRLPFKIFYILFSFLSKIIYLKSIDSFLGLLSNRKKFKHSKEYNIFTKKKFI